jgi:hypothetical protein
MIFGGEKVHIGIEVDRPEGPYYPGDPLYGSLIRVVPRRRDPFVPEAKGDFVNRCIYLLVDRQGKRKRDFPRLAWLKIRRRGHLDPF